MDLSSTKTMEGKSLEQSGDEESLTAFLVGKAVALLVTGPLRAGAHQYLGIAERSAPALLPITAAASRRH